MDPKQQTIEYVKSLGASKGISRQELLAAYDSGSGATMTQTHSGSIGIAEIMYYIGGAVVFLGIIILVLEHWSELSFPARLLITLGGSIAAYIVGVLFGTQQKLEGPSNSFFLISALVLPMGLYVVFQNAGYNIGDSSTQSILSAILFAVFIASYTVYRREVFALFSIVFGTLLFYTYTNYLVGQNPYFDSTSFFEYRTLLSGLCYLLLGYAFKQGKLESLTGALFSFGVLGFLGAALALGGFEPNQNPFWELVYPLFVFGFLYGSVYPKSKSLLTFSTIFLMAYILKITSEYFTQGFGWPLALVIAGLAMIGVGYLSVTLNKKYIAVA